MNKIKKEKGKGKEINMRNGTSKRVEKMEEVRGQTEGPLQTQLGCHFQN